MMTTNATTSLNSSSPLFKIQPKSHSSTRYTPKPVVSFHICNKETIVNTNIINRYETSKWILRNNNRTAVITSPSSSSDNYTGEPSASDVVRMFYQGINRRNLATVEPLIANNCVYEDLMFPQPFVGRKAILEFFKEFTDSISIEFQFAIDDISEDASSAVGVKWHLEWKGKPFPFSRGCSFYVVEVIDGQKQITFGRDIVEPAIKPGDTALAAIKGVTWLLEKIPKLADML